MWINDEYFYSVGTLRTVANNYESFEDYESSEFIWGLVARELELAEFHADFDMAWKALPWKMYCIVDYDIKGLDDHELEEKGFYNPEKYKKITYRRMAKYLNEGATMIKRENLIANGSMNQEEYTQFYKGMRHYAKGEARGYFCGEGQLEDAVDVAMDKVNDWLITNNKAEYPTAYVKTLIRNSIKRQSKERKYEVVDIKWTGSTVYQKINRDKPLKVRLEQITNKKHKEIVKLCLDSLTQEQIAERVHLNQSTISRILDAYF